ncbi:hypothetical protein [Skermanella pratensis]|uniref:hypothetical protein n=1 Tax=Skermanella pratensis TaxID=2233999 RepID=UPI0017889CD4|nr:hypothetical protein [Skermanella pratensis]
MQDTDLQATDLQATDLQATDLQATVDAELSTARATIDQMIDGSISFLPKSPSAASFSSCSG